MTTRTDITSPGLTVDTSFFGHPRGLFICFATEMWERFSVYGMKFLLLLYLNLLLTVHGLLLPILAALKYPQAPFLQMTNP